MAKITQLTFHYYVSEQLFIYVKDRAIISQYVAFLFHYRYYYL